MNHLKDVHEAKVLVPKNVAVKDESANVISAEVDAEPDTGIGMGGVAIPIGNFNHVQVLASDSRRLLVTVDRKIVLRFNQEVKLVEVKFVILQRVILHRPLLHSPLSRRNGGRRAPVDEHLSPALCTPVESSQ